MNHYRYLQNAQRYGSAHYYVDDKEIIQTIGDSRIAWSVGDTWAKKNRTRSDVTNANSINVEMCVNSDGDYEQTFKNTVELVKNLMIRFNVPVDRVVRHFDASGKICPRSMCENNWRKWWEFKYEIAKPRELIIDLDRDSTAKEVKTMETKEKTRFESKNGLDMIITYPQNLRIQLAEGLTLRQTGEYGINGTFFDTRNVKGADGCCMIAVDQGVPIQVKNDFDCLKKGIFVIDRAGNMYVDRIGHLKEWTRSDVYFAVGGLQLLPDYDPQGHYWQRDVLRHAWHTGIGYKDGEVYLITTSVRCDMATFRNKLKTLGLEGAIALDGGGSTQMNFKGRGLHQRRGLNTIIRLENK